MTHHGHFADKVWAVLHEVLVGDSRHIEYPNLASDHKIVIFSEKNVIVHR